MGGLCLQTKGVGKCWPKFWGTHCVCPHGMTVTQFCRLHIEGGEFLWVIIPKPLGTGLECLQGFGTPVYIYAV